MIELKKKESSIIAILLERGSLSSSAIHEIVSRGGDGISLVTVKRLLSGMADKKLLKVAGSGRTTAYRVATLGRVYFDIDAKAYCAVEPDRRFGSAAYNFDLFREFPRDVFTASELERLETTTKDYMKRVKQASLVTQRKELERLVIELSWKSSKIEGNTYTLLDTEKLILKHEEAKGHDKNEAHMILNHKDAFQFIRDHTNAFRVLTRTNLEQIHALLIKGLGVGKGLRRGVVGVTGSKYRPLDNQYHLAEAVRDFSSAVSRLRSPYAKALGALVGIGYIQPFEDGNKRTSRLAANALLMAHGCAPLSYRSVDENEYRETLLVFYELNSIQPLKKIFIEQYVFAAEHYAAK